MKNYILLAILLVLPILVKGQQKDKKETEKALRIIPLITSTPLMGTGVGVGASYLYAGDNSNASKSQLSVGGQYTTTDSYNIFATNNLWLRDNGIRSTTKGTYSSINNEFDLDGVDVAYNINTVLMDAIVLKRTSENIYMGGGLMFKTVSYKPINEGGEDFIESNAIENETTGGMAVGASYDSRKNKYYPTNGFFVSSRLNAYPEFLGSENNYQSLILDARYYTKIFNENSVLASQLFGQFSSDKTPDAGLPSLSGKSILRGFPNGKYKAKYMSGGQTEYRYTIPNSKFRVTGFVGVANLAGGSYGDGTNSRDDDGWYSATGLGARYRLQAITGVDVRLDFVHTSDNEFSVYLKLNQAF